MAIKTPAPERTAGRKRLASQGHALSDGSFPIPNTRYLKKAIRAVGRAAAGKRPALARLIRKRARQLGAWNVVKGSWADNTQSTKAMANAMYRQLVELGFSPALARAEVQGTLPFMVRELTTSVVGSMDGPRVTGLASSDSKSKLVSKASVHYREASDPKRCCGTCRNRQGSRCDVVAGTVDRNDVCDRFATKTASYANNPEAAKLELARKKFDPDNDGDNDASPSGDTDNDYAGKLSPVQRAAMKRMIAKGMSPQRAYKLACNINSGAKKAA